MALEFTGSHSPHVPLLLLLLLMWAIAVPLSSASSIPIWEFLNRNEKMSQLYSTFAQLVSVHCKLMAGNGWHPSPASSSSSSPAISPSSIHQSMPIPVNQCKHDLLQYGYGRLQSFSDDQLDAFDPYQRGASALLWKSIMRNHSNSRLLVTNSVRYPSADSVSASSERIPTQTENSASSLLLVLRPHPYQSQQQTNPLFETSNQGIAPQRPKPHGEQEREQQQYAMNMDISYGYPNYPSSMDFDETTDTDMESPSKQPSTRWKNTFLTGPLVIRVKPDGSPVEEDRFKPLPKDDDLELFGSQASLSHQQQFTSFPTHHRKPKNFHSVHQQQ